MTRTAIPDSPEGIDVTTLLNVLARQRRPLLVALLLCVAGLWLSIPSGKGEIGIFFAIGVFLSLLNHILTEIGLARSLANEGEISRKEFAFGSFGRLMVVTALAAVFVIAFWPYGAGVLFGLAVMHLVLLVFTGLPLLNEMRKV
jgi:hypothetical protein